jgi:Protein of unknown function (DUF2934)
MYSVLSTTMINSSGRTHSTHAHRQPARSDEDVLVRREPTHEETASLAYSYWEAGGRHEGTALWDWLRAERDLGRSR